MSKWYQWILKWAKPNDWDNQEGKLVELWQQQRICMKCPPSCYPDSIMKSVVWKGIKKKQTQTIYLKWTTEDRHGKAYQTEVY